MIRYHEIASLDDPMLDSWLDLYQTAFPLTEQMLASAHLRALREKAAGGQQDTHYIVGVDGDEVVAMARYDLDRECGAGALWYLAVDPDRRGSGIGAATYKYVRDCLLRELPTALLVIEVEDPGHLADQADRVLAERRIAFYRRCGARLLGGIDYVQTVGWQPPVPMRVMVDPPSDALDPVDAARIARCVLGDTMVAGSPRWE